MPENTKTLFFDEEMNYICSNCGNQVKSIDFYDSFKEVNRKIPGTCPCQEKMQETMRLKEERRAKAERAAYLRDIAQLGRYSDSTLDTFQPRVGTEKALWECKRLAAEFPREAGILLFGAYGNGKSRLVAAVANALITKGYICLFRNVPRLFAEIKQTFDTNAPIREWRVMELLKKADLLILDDLGAHKWTEWREDTLYAIIDDRYSAQKPIIATTNCNLDDLEDRIGGRSFDRLKEMCLIVENTADSYRQIIAQERLKQVTGPDQRRKRA